MALERACREGGSELRNHRKHEIAARRDVHEIGADRGRSAKPDEVIELYGSVFVASQWGSATNVPFRYRLNVGPIHGNTQTVKLYLTPMGTISGRDFLAFKYLYTRRPAG